MLTGTEGAEGLCGLRDRPADFFVVLNGQAPLFGLLLEAGVMIGAATGSVLNTVHVTVHVDHLMDQSSDHVSGRAVQGFGAQVDLPITLFRFTGLPGVVFGIVTVGAGSGLNGDQGP